MFGHTCLLWCCNTFPQSWDFQGFIVKGCWILLQAFWNQLKESCNFCHWIYLQVAFYLLTYISWAIPESVEWSNMIMVNDLFNKLLSFVCKHFIQNFCTDRFKSFILQSKLLNEETACRIWKTSLTPTYLTKDRCLGYTNKWND